MSVRVFGHCGQGEILEATLASSDGLEARVITLGAVLRDLRVPGRAGPQGVVLGFDQLEPYLDQPGYLGAVVGRYANRIAGSRYRQDGEEVRLVANEGRHMLHGGPVGFGQRRWSLVAHDGASAHLALLSQDGDMGFPGRLFALASYELREPATLRLTLQAFADRKTPVNLTTHSYYNLDGSPDVRDHRLTVTADSFTPVDSELIPTGEIVSVAGTAFDFRRPRTLRDAAPEAGYDTNLVLARDGGPERELVRAATLSSTTNGISMELWTTEPGLQLYDGHQLAIGLFGRGGVAYGRCAGVALEPQRFPDGPNWPLFPGSIVSPGTVSRQITELRFSVEG